MKKGFKLIVPSFLAIIVCVLLVTASTYALFTSDATVNLSVGSATVKVSAEVTNMKTYSITHENTGNFDVAGTIQDGDFAATYYYALQEEGKFAVGGTASFANGTLTLDKMVPGDKVTFTLDSANQSNVDVKYRLSIEATENSSEALLSVLQFKIGDETIRGLKNYYTEWFNSADTALTDTNFEILFPLNSGNTFQTKTVGYSITLQAVQANAKTSGEKNYETIDLYVEEVKSTAQAVVAEQTTNVQIDVPSVEIDDTNLSVSASIPADNTYKDADDQSMDVSSTSLKVSDLFVQSNSQTNETTIAADVKLLDQDGNEIKSVQGDKAVTVTVYVGKGFNSVKVKHNGHLIPTTTEDAGYGHSSSYNSETGYVTFKTSSFSPFEFIGEFAAAVIIGDNIPVFYGDLRTAFLAANSYEGNEKVVVSILSDCGATEYIPLTRSMTIEGNGKTITNSANRIFRFSAANLDIKFFDLTMNSTCTDNSDVRGISFDSNASGSSLLLDHCNISASFYVINVVQGPSNLNVVIKDGTVAAGWAAINAYSSNSTFTIENSTLTGLNDKDYNADGWNNFNTITIDGGNQAGLYGHDNVINITKSTVYASSTSGNKQHWVGLQYKAINNVVNVDNLTRIINASEEDESDSYYVSSLPNSIRINGVEKLPQPNVFYTNGPAIYANGTITAGNPSDAMTTFFTQPFTGGWLADGEGLKLTDDVVLTSNVTLNMQSGSIYLIFDGHTITGGKIVLQGTASVISEVGNMTSVFAGNVQVQQNEDGSFTYSLSEQ